MNNKTISGPILLHEPYFRGNEWKRVRECLDSGWVSTAGQFVEAFEKSVADYLGVQYAVATVNGTAALHVALLSVGVQPEEEVLVSALTFVASANAVKYCGAYPVFMDANWESWCMDPQKVADFIVNECSYKNGSLRNRQTGRRIAAIVPVHLLGHPVDLDPLLELGERYNLPVVADAAQGLGSLYKGKHVASLGNAACVSFNGNKIVTSGGGGMVVTDESQLADRLRHLTTQARADELEYWHDQLGYNYRMPNINAALGVAQLEHLRSNVEIKRRIAYKYCEGVKELPSLTFMPEASWAHSTYWLNVILLDNNSTLAMRNQVVGDLRNSNIQASPLWTSLHWLPIYANSQAYHIEVADELCRRGIALPSSVGLGDDDQIYVLRCLGSVLQI